MQGKKVERKMHEKAKPTEAPEISFMFHTTDSERSDRSKVRVLRDHQRPNRVRPMHRLIWIELDWIIWVIAC